MADGKHTFVALRELRDEWKAAADGDDPMFTQALLDAFEQGVDCQMVAFEDDDDIVFAWATASHDLESNKFKPSSLRDMVEVARRYRKRVPGGSWSDTQAKLEAIYGSRKRSVTGGPMMVVSENNIQSQYVQSAFVKVWGHLSVPPGL